MTAQRATGSIERNLHTLIQVPLLFIMTSNLDCDEWGEAFPSKLLAASTEEAVGDAPLQSDIDKVCQ